MLSKKYRPKTIADQENVMSHDQVSAQRGACSRTGYGGDDRVEDV